jgi:hypothetical protein
MGVIDVRNLPKLTSILRPDLAPSWIVVLASDTLLLGRGNVIGDLRQNELIQTNATLKVPFKWVSGTFHVSLPQLFPADSILQSSEYNRMVSRFLGRIIVCDMEIFRDDADGNACSGNDVILATIEIFAKLLSGQLRLTLNRQAVSCPCCAGIAISLKLAGLLIKPPLCFSTLCKSCYTDPSSV